MKSKKIIRAVICSVLILGVAYAFFGNPLVYINTHRLKNSVRSIEQETVSLNEVVPFAWDAVYTFDPYESKEHIEEIVGFSSPNIKANNINEGMVHLLFVKGNGVAASVLSYSGGLGYEISLYPKAKVTYAENAQFQVEKRDGITVLSLMP